MEDAVKPGIIKGKKVFVVVNPASGKNEPILNSLNTVFTKYGVEWEVGVTHKFGDGLNYTNKAIEEGFDVIVGYGGDGTQHEIASGVIGKDVLMGILPGGTGNGFAAGLGIPKDTVRAIEIMCETDYIADVDIAQVGDTYMLSRMYTGIEPEEQTSREMKDKYGLLAYAVTGIERAKSSKPIKYKITVDGEVHEVDATKIYIANSGSTGVNINIGNFNPTDGILDVFAVGSDMKSIVANVERFFQSDNQKADFNYWRGKDITLEPVESQAVWADGENIGRTPVTAKILEGALKVIAPKIDRSGSHKPAFIIERAK
jgi:YegS/Rv2252/BmrU family lipid kinase